MRQLEYTLQFTTPAFLGNAEQNAQWRTPPIKALLRQWWRVAYAAEHQFRVDVAAMRREEGLLFGVASDGEGDSRKSQIRIRLNRWDAGRLTRSQWPTLGTVAHPEVRQAVASDLYLGYGPVTLPRRAQRPTLKANAAIQADETATLALAVPETVAPRIERALWLMDRYGTLGGRSRNGWGSFALLTPSAGGAVPLRPWRDCLDRDWPHALGRDAQGALIWQTAAHTDWKALMRDLAIIKIELRTRFVFTTGRNAPRTEDRHWLSYPVTNHSVAAWGNNARMPNSLRFKVRKSADGKLVGVIFHVPHLPPAGFRPDRPAIEAVWQQVYQFLDAAPQLTRVTE